MENEEEEEIIIAGQFGQCHHQSGIIIGKSMSQKMNYNGFGQYKNDPFGINQ